jgi:hypothetical protein
LTVEGEAIERGVRRTIEYRDVVTRNLIRSVYRFRDAILVDEKKGDFSPALQNLYRELRKALEDSEPTQMRLGHEGLLGKCLTYIPAP